MLADSVGVFFWKKKEKRNICLNLHGLSLATPALEPAVYATINRRYCGIQKRVIPKNVTFARLPTHRRKLHVVLGENDCERNSPVDIDNSHPI